MSVEPITEEEVDRPLIKPLRYPDIWEYRQKIVASHWTVESVDDLGDDDKRTWDTLTDDEKHYFRYIFAFFAHFDQIVGDNLMDNFLNEITVSEIKSFLVQQCAQEDIHNVAYAEQLTILFNGKELKELANAIYEWKSISDMAEWTRQWMDRKFPLGQRLVGFAIVEGIFFQCQFVSLQLLRERSKLIGITAVNEYIMRDEAMHCDFAAYLYRRHIINKLDVGVIFKMVETAVKLVDAFIAEALNGKKINNINSELMHDTIRHFANGLCHRLGYESPWPEIKNPYPELKKMELSAYTKTNFFEKEPTQYHEIIEKNALSIKKIDEASFYW
jgi:ribonucleoside-diphosphate reductase beta chain